MAQLSPRLRARLARVPDIAREAAARAMEEVAQEIVDEMKRLAPVLRTPDKRRTAGALRDSIGWTWGDVPAGSFVIDEIRSGKNKGNQYATLRIRIYAGSKDAFYARFVEFGTKTGGPAQPFFFPVWKARRAEFRRRVRDSVRRAIREAWDNG